MNTEDFWQKIPDYLIATILSRSVPDCEYHLKHKDEREISFFLTQQYRLFSNYSASLQMDMCYSNCRWIISTIFGMEQLFFVGIRYVGKSPNPSPDWYCCRILLCRNSYRMWIAVKSIRFKWKYLSEFRQDSICPPPYLIILGFVSVDF